MPPVKTSKKTKRRDERPARKLYWLRRTLEKHKVKHLMQNGYTEPQALQHWRKMRKGRVPDGFIFRIEPRD